MSLLNPNPVSPTRRKRIALVLANPGVSSVTGWPVGFWWSELTHPYFEFMEAGYEVDLFSPEGGACEPDALSDPRDPSGYSASDLITLGFLSSPSMAPLISETRPVSAADPAAYDALLVAGGQSPMFTFEAASTLHRQCEAFLESGKVLAALCHGVAVLRWVRRPDGTPAVAGKTLTGFANVEEDFADQAVWSLGALPAGTSLMPWRIEDAMKSLGANYIQSGLWRAFAVRDGQLITGQQNFSGAATARLVIETLGR